MPSKDRGLENRYLKGRGVRPAGMKIGLVVYGSLDVATGGNVYDRMLVSRLRARGDQVEIVSLRKQAYPRNLLDNLSVHLPAGLDLLLQDELTHPSLLRANVAHRGYPVISIVHNLHSSERRPRWQNAMYAAIERRYLDSVDGLVLNSAATLESVRDGLGVDKPFVVATPAGDRLGSLSPSAVNARAFKAGPLQLIYLANITALKGLRVLLDSLDSLPRDGFELDVVGSWEPEPAYARAMQRQAARLGAGIMFHGVLDGRALIEKLKRAQVMVVPSYYEGFGISYLEGMAFGLPAIGCNAGAVPEIISDGTNGFLIAPGDSTALAGRLSALASDRRMLAHMAGAALRYFRSQPTWNESGDAVRAFLASLLGGRVSLDRDRGAQ